MSYEPNARDARPAPTDAEATQEKRTGRGFWRSLYAAMVKRHTRSILRELRAHRRLVRDIRLAPGSFSLAQLKHQGQLPFDR